MTERWRLLVVAAALNLAVGVGIGSAQTVFVMNAPGGAGIEISLDATTIGSATANARGDATVTAKLPAKLVDAGTDVRIYVDACEKIRRVLLVQRGMQPADPQPGCDRKEVVGFYLIRGVTSLVVDMKVPTVWLRQGSVPEQWLSHETSSAPTKAMRPSPVGLVLFGGPGFVKVRDAVALACGNVSDCSGKDFRPAIAVGAAYWLTRFLGAEASFVQPSSIEVSGGGSGYRFNSTQRFHLVTVVAKGALPLGPVRIYGNAGANYTRGTFTTTDTIDPVTVTIGDTTQTFPGGTQTSSRDTAGWGWLFGGGIEGWLTPSIGLFGEADYARIKGTVINSTEGGVDDRVTLLVFGVRVHLGRH